LIVRLFYVLPKPLSQIWLSRTIICVLQDAYSPQGSSPQDPLEGYMNMLQHTPGKCVMSSETVHDVIV